MQLLGYITCLSFLSWWCLHQPSGLWLFMFVSTKYLYIASSPLSSNLCRSSCSSFAWSWLKWCSQNLQEESKATNCNKERLDVFLYFLLFSLSLRFSSFLNFTSRWEWGHTMAGERANVLLLWDRHMLLLAWQVLKYMCVSCIILSRETGPQQSCSVMGLGAFVKGTFLPGHLPLKTGGQVAAVTEMTWWMVWTRPACHPLSGEVWWTRLLSWHFLCVCLSVLGRCGCKLVCSSDGWPVVGDAKWQQDHHPWAPTSACWRGWWGVRATPLPGDGKQWNANTNGTFVVEAPQLEGYGQAKCNGYCSAQSLACRGKGCPKTGVIRTFGSLTSPVNWTWPCYHIEELFTVLWLPHCKALSFGTQQDG